MADLSEYLLSRGLTLDAAEIAKKEDLILENDELLSELARVWESHKNLIALVIQLRVNAIGERMLKNAIPQEVIVLRQALVEVGAIVDDFVKYQREAERRKKELDKPADASAATSSEEENSL